MRKKLRLKAETVRTLTTSDTLRVRGGAAMPSDGCPSNEPAGCLSHVVCPLVALLIALCLSACTLDTGTVVQREDEEETGGDGPCPDEGGDCNDDPPWSAAWCAAHPGAPLCAPGSCTEWSDGIIDWGSCWPGTSPPNQWGSSWVREFACDITSSGNIDWNHCRYTGSNDPGWVPCGRAPQLCDDWDREDWGEAGPLIVWMPPTPGWLGDQAEQACVDAGAVERPIQEPCTETATAITCCAREGVTRCCVTVDTSTWRITSSCELSAP